MPEETPDLSKQSPETPAGAETEVSTTRHSSREPVKVETPQPRWLAPAALLLAVIAVGLAVWAVVGSSSSGSDSASGSGAQGDPKTRTCTAFATVSQAVQLQTNNELGPDPVAQAAVAGNARLALFGGGVYLQNTLGSDTPSDIAGPAQRFASGLQEIGISALAGIVNTDPAQAARLSDADAERKQLLELCK